MKRLLAVAAMIVAVGLLLATCASTNIQAVQRAFDDALSALEHPETDADNQRLEPDTTALEEFIRRYRNETDPEIKKLVERAMNSVDEYHWKLVQQGKLKLERFDPYTDTYKKMKDEALRQRRPGYAKLQQLLRERQNPINQPAYLLRLFEIFFGDRESEGFAADACPPYQDVLLECVREPSLRLDLAEALKKCTTYCAVEQCVKIQSLLEQRRGNCRAKIDVQLGNTASGFPLPSFWYRSAEGPEGRRQVSARANLGFLAVVLEGYVIGDQVLSVDLDRYLLVSQESGDDFPCVGWYFYSSSAPGFSPDNGDYVAFRFNNPLKLQFQDPMGKPLKFVLLFAVNKPDVKPEDLYLSYRGRNLCVNWYASFQSVAPSLIDRTELKVKILAGSGDLEPPRWMETP